ncbi:MAG: T9SS type A sorting domain-containing protein [Candidatus Eisenbacteria bacterium]|nr:T9SS type A sorting domain-containing protein [Candidatus Eisenbacteria bacterium]
MRTTTRIFVLTLALVALAAAAHGADGGPKIQALVEFESYAEWREFVSTPGLDVMRSKPGIMVQIVTDAEELEELRSRGLRITVEIEDMERHYASRIRGPNFGDFHTYSEMIDFIDDLHADYPLITTARESIGASWEGRAIWAIKISDNPDVDESEPEVFFDGMHHAREPMSLEVQLHYMTWLCSNYGTDPEATFLVDNREIWFVPVVNPDGFVYNETTYPSGGGMWRKNRRDNAGSSCYGVDPNRNYDYMWGTSGISFDPCSDVYCGPSGFSEPEIQAYRDFVLDRDFITNVTFHSVAGMVLLPWGYDYNDQTPDDALFRTMANEMAKYNGYQVGQAGEILYDCSGTTCDWAYGVADVLSLCVEVSGSGFWPAESEIAGLNEECLWPQIYVTRVAGGYLGVDEYTLSGGDGDGEPDAGETLDLVATIENQGVGLDMTNVDVTLSTDDAYVTLHDATTTLGSVPALSTADNGSDPFSFTLDASCPDGHGLTLTLEISGDNFYAEEDISWMVGTPTVVFSDDMESGTGNWVESDGYWGLTSSTYHSSSNSYTDSPSGSYGNYRNTWIELATPIDFSNAAAAELSFWHRVNTETDYDYCYVEASADNGATWSQVGPKYHSDNGGWEQVDLDLSPYVGTDQFTLRFRFNSDAYVTDDGWYIDDVTIYGPDPSNAPPGAPVLSDPPDGGTVSTPTPALEVSNATDADAGDVLTYGFLVYDDAERTSLVTSTTGVAEGSGTTAWTVGTSLGSGTYYWTAYADDGTERGPLMETGSFTVDDTGIEGGPAKLALHPPLPNPFAGRTMISFESPAATEARVEVYSVDGRLVRTLLAGTVGAGRTELSWDGRDQTGRRLGSGLYFVRVSTPEETRHGKIVVLR